MQVIALMVRSMARIGEAPLEASREIDYAVTINRALPSDIRILGWAPVPEDFSARWHPNLIRLQADLHQFMHLQELVMFYVYFFDTFQRS